MTRTNVPITEKRPRAKPDRPHIVEFVTDPQCLNLSISDAQGTLLKSMYGLPLTPSERDIFEHCTGRTTYREGHSYPEITCIAGARSGKDSRIAAPVALYEACFGGHTLSKGERGIIPIVAAGRDGTKIAYNYIRDYILQSPILRTMLADEPLQNEIPLKNGITVKVFPNTVAALRGWSICTAILDEVGFWRLEGNVHSDTEVQTSVRRGMVNFTGTKLLKVSTPYLKDGILFEDHKRGFGVDSEEDLLVWQAPTLLMNPALNATTIDRERRADPSRAMREYDALFIDDLEAFLSGPWLESCIIKGRTALAPRPDRYFYTAGIDSSGGGSCAFTCSIVHPEGDGGPSTRLVQDYCRGWLKSRTSRLDVEGVVAEIATVLKSFAIEWVWSDRYAADWVPQAFARHGIRVIGYVPDENIKVPDKSTALVELEPWIMQARIDLLDHSQQSRELSLLERKNRPGGKPLIEKARGGYDDYAAALALSVYGALNVTEPPAEVTAWDIWGHGDRGIPEDEIAGDGLRHSSEGLAWMPKKKTTGPMKTEPSPERDREYGGNDRDGIITRSLTSSVVRMIREARHDGIGDKEMREFLIDLFSDPYKRTRILNRKLGLAEGSLHPAHWDYIVTRALKADRENPASVPPPQRIPESDEPRVAGNFLSNW